MPVVDGLRRLDSQPPDIDLDAMYDRVARRVRRRRQRRRIVAGAAAVIVALVSFLEVRTSPDSRTLLDTAGGGAEVPAEPRLPDAVPEGFSLGWVDIYEQSPGDVWTERSSPAFALGYQDGARELELRIFPGMSLDLDAVRRAWGRAIDVVADEPGREVVTNGRRSEAALLLAFDGGVAMVLPHWADPSQLVPLDVQVTLARSLRAVSVGEWTAALEGVDVAPPMGVLSRETVVEGDGWWLEGQWFRPPAARTHRSLAVRFASTSATVENASFTPDWGRLDDTVDMSLLRHEGHTIAWGTAPAGTSSVRLRFIERTATADAVPFADGAVFAVDVGDVASDPRLVEALDSTGRVVASVVNATDRSCEPGEDGPVTVPDVIGLRLWDAIAVIDGAGLHVVGTGTRPGDPTGDEAIVVVQAPEAGDKVPGGACVGFGTE
jgi:hypothetical protein